MSNWRDNLGLRKVNGSWFIDGRTDLKWYQHRHPNPKMRWAGVAMMVVGTFHIAWGFAFFG